MNYSLLALIEMAAHTAPSTPLSVDSAHEIMRLHRECPAGRCPRKSAAFDSLAAAGRLVPDSGRRT
ncbi:hypothetical protein C8258_08910 [Nocardia sp. MDA0666]|uniref:hypothetical protein n=1 Tax=Nocardia sp. MDA0666 TaxID=2135448 RepID=UPI000D12CB50|nr:hypothetical protein [Nocardia sp. MDA0666]PSR68617.1 hypothetical protein C8258_08910 [Nocardia sp. MDA0666]